jgi:hypothetical protein
MNRRAFLSLPAALRAILRENLVEYDRLENLKEGHIELQAHQAGKWLEYKHIWVKRL